MDSVWRVKAGDLGAQVRDAMHESARNLLDRGAEVIVAGCSEVPLLVSGDSLGAPFLDATEVLAQRTVAYARGEALQ